MKKPSLPAPQFIRFRTADLELIQSAAEKADERVSPWIRAVVLERADVVLAGKVRELKLVPAGPEARCVRFRPLALARVVKAAKQEKLTVAEWIRAVAVGRAKT